MRSAIFILMLLASPTFAAEPIYSWRSLGTDPDRVYLHLDGQQIGGWCYRASHYRSFDGTNWGDPVASPPVQVPTRVQVTITKMSSSSRPNRLLGRRLDRALNSIADNVAREALTGPFMQNAIRDALAKPIAEPSKDEQNQTMQLYGLLFVKCLITLMTS